MENKKLNWKCKYFGHKWIPCFIKGRYSNIKVKFIGAICERCEFGLPDLHDTINKQTWNDYNTYSEKYFVN